MLRSIFAAFGLSLLLFAGLGIARAADPAKQPDEFRGIHWGAQVTAVQGLTQVDRDGDILHYTRPGEAKQLGGIPLRYVTYSFYKGRFYHVLEKGIPELDSNGRPKMFYGELVHDNCPRLPHFEASEFAPSFDSEEAKKGYCLYELGCKGPVTYNNCPKVLFNQVNWPVQAGHPCLGCSEPDFWDTMCDIALKELRTLGGEATGKNDG